VIGVPVADEHGVELADGHVLEQPWHGRVTRIDEQPEAVVLDQEAAARLARLGPGTARAENSEPHGHHHNGRDRTRTSA
jgi:hypothetical protein